MTALQGLKKLALLVGGGPAPGINGVISAVTIEAINNNVEVYGFRDGFKWLVREDADFLEDLVKNEKKYIQQLRMDDVRNINRRGGSILGTSRTNPTKKKEDMQRVLQVLQQLRIDALVTIGGDDTAYSASQVHAACGGKIRVAHVPKTIDNDLPLPESTPTFGFETARQVGTFILGNLIEDARTTSRWYIVVTMGRAAGYLALGIGKAAAATLTIIPEEFGKRQVTLREVCDIILGSIIKRRRLKRQHGVVVLAEGLLEAIGARGLVEGLGSEKLIEAEMAAELLQKLNECKPDQPPQELDLGKYGVITLDPHGHIRLGEIDFARMVTDWLQGQLEKLHLETTFISKDLGYELRCADPIPFDAEYTRDLGYGAFKFLRSSAALEYGAIISYVEGRMEPQPFEKMIDPETKRMRTRKVNVDGEGYECARSYMIRLEKEDFDKPEELDKLAGIVRMTPEQFRERFGYLVG